MKTLLFCISLLSLAAQATASLASDKVAEYRKLIVEYGAEHVAEKYDSSAYLFQVTNDEKIINVLMLFDDATAGGDIFLSERLMNMSGTGTRRVAWRQIPAHELSRLLYVIEHSDALSLGKRIYADPLGITVLTEETIFRLVARQPNRTIAIERESNDSLPMDYVFGFICREIIRGLSVGKH